MKSLIPPLLLLATACHAGPFSDLFVFGDSLSDVGNVLGNRLIAAIAGIDDFDNRFSNGPVYSERLSIGLGLGTLVHSEAGGDNFANGGAETNGPNGFFDGPLIDSLVEQVDTYLGRLGSGSADPLALHVVFIGANDFLGGGQTNVTIPANVVRTQFDRLVSAGARQFLGVNLPDLGLTPADLGNTALTARSESYNSALEGVYAAVELVTPDVTIHRLDTASLFDNLVENAASFGFTNVTQPGQELPGDSFDRAPGYLFWDDVHPTRETHALLAEAAIRAVLPTGDYDRDGVLAAEDYSVWRDDYGVAFNAVLGQTPTLAADANGDGRIDAADYTVWRDSLASPPVAVPEPGPLTLVALALALRAVHRRPG